MIHTINCSASWRARDWIEIRIESRVIKKFGERGGRPVIFLLRTKYFFRAIDFVLGDKKTKIYMPLIDLSVR